MAMILASCSPSRILSVGGLARFFPLSVWSKPRSTKRRRTFSTVLVRQENASAICLSVQFGPFSSALSGIGARRTKRMITLDSRAQNQRFLGPQPIKITNTLLSGPRTPSHEPRTSVRADLRTPHAAGQRPRGAQWLSAIPSSSTSAARRSRQERKPRRSSREDAARATSPQAHTRSSPSPPRWPICSRRGADGRTPARLCTRRRPSFWRPAGGRIGGIAHQGH